MDSFEGEQQLPSQTLDEPYYDQVFDSCSSPSIDIHAYYDRGDKNEFNKRSYTSIPASPYESSGSPIPRATSESHYVRPQTRVKSCPHCSDHAEWFCGEHRLWRHLKRAHPGSRKVWVCVDPTPEKRFLKGCKPCDNEKEYGADLNAAAHLRRTHFNPKRQRDRGLGNVEEKRGGKEGGSYPPMEELRPYMEERFVHINLIDDGEDLGVEAPNMAIKEDSAISNTEEKSPKSNPQPSLSLLSDKFALKPVSAPDLYGLKGKLSQSNEDPSPAAYTNCSTRTTPLWRCNSEVSDMCGLFSKLQWVFRPLSLRTDAFKLTNRGAEGSFSSPTRSMRTLQQDRQTASGSKPLGIPVQKSSSYRIRHDSGDAQTHTSGSEGPQDEEGLTMKFFGKSKSEKMEQGKPDEGKPAVGMPAKANSQMLSSRSNLPEQENTHPTLRMASGHRRLSAFLSKMAWVITLNVLSSLYRPPVPHGMRRIEWTCSCGLRMFDDYKELRCGALDRLEATLIRSSCSLSSARQWREWPASFFRSCPSGSQQESQYGPSPTQQMSQTGARSNTSGSQKDTRNEPNRIPQQDNQIFTPYSPQSWWTQNTVTKYLLLLLPHKQTASKVEHMDNTREALSDRAFFRNLRERHHTAREYGEARRNITRKLWELFSLRTLLDIRFVHFEVFRNGLAQVHKVDTVPPADLAHTYEYKPMPPEYSPPIGPNLLLHLYHYPEDADDGLVLVPRMPKKLHGCLEACPKKGCSPGWGLNLAEGVSKVRLCLFGLVGTVSSLVFGIAWSLGKGGDVQGGFTIAAYLMMMFSVAIGAVQGILEK